MIIKEENWGEKKRGTRARKEWDREKQRKKRIRN